MSLIRRSLRAVASWLGTDPESVPSVFHNDAGVQPVLDVAQGFATVEAWLTDDEQVAASTAAGTIVLISTISTPHDGAFVFGMHVGHEGGAAPATVRPVRFGQSGIGVYLGSADVAAGGGLATHKDLFGTGDAVIYVPPGHTLRLAHPATGVGETINVSFSWARVPEGINPR